jgi:hypothetical protein
VTGDYVYGGNIKRVPWKYQFPLDKMLMRPMLKLLSNKGGAPTFYVNENG